uniref:PHD-type domain-containing protein n=2 Tax=Amphimedon queenslandica TaxID=400682 RepID=A0A1X7UBE0_AMPQE
MPVAPLDLVGPTYSYNRFNDMELSTLKKHYDKGMTGVGKVYGPLIESACKESGLNAGQIKFNELETLGFNGFAIAFSGEDVDIVGTSASMKCFKPEFIDYVCSVIKAANPPVNINAATCSSPANIIKEANLPASNIDTRNTKWTGSPTKDQEREALFSSTCVHSNTIALLLSSGAQLSPLPSLVMSTNRPKSSVLPTSHSKPTHLLPVLNFVTTPRTQSVPVSMPLNFFQNSVLIAPSPTTQPNHSISSCHPKPSSSTTPTCTTFSDSIQAASMPKYISATVTSTSSTITSSSLVPVLSSHPKPLLSMTSTTIHSDSLLTISHQRNSSFPVTTNAPIPLPYSTSSIPSPVIQETNTCPPSPVKPLLVTDIESEACPYDLTDILPPVSPEKLWVKIGKMELDICCKDIIQKGEWLASTIIDAAQMLLKSQDTTINGWQSPEIGRKYEFRPTKSPLIQILFVNQNHWVVVSTLQCEPGTLNIYDSAYNLLRLDTKLQISSFYKAETCEIKYNFQDIKRQSNCHDCGVFSIANATALVLGKNPALYNWDVKRMRQHLINCFEKGQLTFFPYTTLRRIKADFTKRTDTEKVYCFCRTINNPKKAMIQCSTCRVWFHIECVKAEDIDNKWHCKNCL